MPVIPATEADAHDCPFDNFSPCRGPKCMAWAWSGPAFDFAETDNLQNTDEGQRPIGVPAPPTEDGNWETDGPPYQKSYHRSDKDKLPKATGQRWRRARKLQLGSCGRANADINSYPF